MRAAAALALLVLAGAAAAAEPPVRGIYAEGRSGLAWIVPCGSGKRLELMDSAAARELRKHFAALAAGRARSMFVEVAGRREDDAFLAEAVLRAQLGGLECSRTCAAWSRRPAGTTSWSMVFDDTRLAFQRVGDGAPASFPPLGPRAARRGFEFKAETERARIDMRLYRERCADPLANAILPYRAEITFARATDPQPGVYRGCAYLGDAAR
ncbi:MAG: hypothetical protein U1F45_04345 [Burkholderiales bacterium]